MLRKVRARRIAQGLLEEFKMSRQAPIDVRKIAEELVTRKTDQVGVSTLSIESKDFPDELQDVSAVLVKEKGSAFIAVNASHSLVRQRFSIAHELGHLILHEGAEYLTVDRYEKQLFTRAEGVGGLDEYEANEFAAALLMPERAISEAFDRLFEEQADNIISQLAQKYEVSEAALSYRLRNLGLL